MKSLYSQLRKIGHGRIESLRRAINNTIERSLPFPNYEPVEVQIEAHISELENLVKKRWRQESLNQDGIKQRLERCVGYLDSQLSNYRERFSEIQVARYEKVLEHLEDKYPSK